MPFENESIVINPIINDTYSNNGSDLFHQPQVNTTEERLMNEGKSKKRTELIKKFLVP